MRASPTTRPLVISVILSLAALTLVSTVAAAQGGLFKKAKDKLAPKAVETGPAPQFDDTLLELTDDRVNLVLKGVVAGRQLKGPNGATVGDLNRQGDAAFSRRDELLKGKDNEMTRYQEDVNKHDQCIHDAVEDLRKKHEKEMAARASSMSAADMQFLQQASMEIGRKFSEHDTAGALQVQVDMMKHFGIDPKADSTQARAKCGKPPAKPAWLSEAEAQLATGNAAMAAARELEFQAVKEQVAKSGLTETQYGLAKERVIAFVNADGKPASTWKFSKGERELLSKRKDEIRKVLVG